jgi:uncharacterized protein with GYD domain
MATFVLFGKYTAESVKGISAARTKKAVALVKKLGGGIQATYATLGEHDLVCIVDLPSVAAAMQASVGLSKMTGIAFTTAPAVPVEEFDKLMAGAR